MTAKPTDHRRPVTRLAPSPTGALHLGNARTFMINWAIGRAAGWRIEMRIDDLDTPRTKVGADKQAIDDLTWLGINWDSDVTYQSANMAHYHRALTTLKQHELIYACTCTRRQIERARSAPHDDDHELRYPGTCRGRQVGDDAPVAWRLCVPDEAIGFDDQVHGSQRVNVQQQVGDFVVVTKAQLPAYQLAVVIDDAEVGVTDVIRGDDLLSSTGRQLWLHRMLDMTPPRYWHLPLVLGPDGRRLAKRHGDARIATYRQAGVGPQRVVGLLAYWSGVVSERTAMSANEFTERFNVDHIPRDPIIFTEADHQWLMNTAD